MQEWPQDEPAAVMCISVQVDRDHVFINSVQYYGEMSIRVGRKQALTDRKISVIALLLREVQLLSFYRRAQV